MRLWRPTRCAKTVFFLCFSFFVLLIFSCYYVIVVSYYYFMFFRSFSFSYQVLFCCCPHVMVSLFFVLTIVFSRSFTFSLRFLFYCVNGGGGADRLRLPRRPALRRRVRAELIGGRIRAPQEAGALRRDAANGGDFHERHHHEVRACVRACRGWHTTCWREMADRHCCVRYI